MPGCPKIVERHFLYGGSMIKHYFLWRHRHKWNKSGPGNSEGLGVSNSGSFRCLTVIPESHALGAPGYLSESLSHVDDNGHYLKFPT